MYKPEPPVETRFKPGQSGNPLGRQQDPVKRMAGAAAWKALRDDFMENGVEAIIQMRINKPEAYVALVASGLPAEKDVTVRRAESLMEEQARLIAETYLESKRRAAAGSPEPDPVHDSVPAGLPTG